MTPAQKKMVAAVAYMQKYMATYDKQPLYTEYSEDTYIRDLLYGCGASLGREYQMAGGFEKFKARLRELLKEHPQ